jgi:hypothetical protein
LAINFYFQRLAGVYFLQIILSKWFIAKFVFRNELRDVFEFWGRKKGHACCVAFSILCIQYSCGGLSTTPRGCGGLARGFDGLGLDRL